VTYAPITPSAAGEPARPILAPASRHDAKEQGFVMGVLLLGATLTIMFSCFSAFVWTAISETVGGSKALPSNFNSFWWLAPVLAVIGLGLDALPLWRSRMTSTWVLAGLALAVIVSALVFCPYF
jgi:hypothetical protein